jgi:hypothetical protein
VISYLDDLASDFSAFHRIDDIEAMDAVRFFKLAVRLPAYAGVLAARALAEQQAAESGSSPSGSPASRSSDDYQVAPTRQAMAADPVLSQVMSFGTG